MTTVRAMGAAAQRRPRRVDDPPKQRPGAEASSVRVRQVARARVVARLRRGRSGSRSSSAAGPRRRAARFISPHERGGRSRDADGERDRGVVPARQQQPVEQVAHRDPLPGLEAQQRLARDRVVRAAPPGARRAAARAGRGRRSSASSCWPSRAIDPGREAASRARSPASSRSQARAGIRGGSGGRRGRAPAPAEIRATATSSRAQRAPAGDAAGQPPLASSLQPSGTRSTQPFSGRSWVSRLGLSCLQPRHRDALLVGDPGEGVAGLHDVVLLGRSASWAPRFGRSAGARLRIRRRTRRPPTATTIAADDQRQHGEDPRGGPRARPRLGCLWLHLCPAGPRAGHRVAVARGTYGVGFSCGDGSRRRPRVAAQADRQPLAQAPVTRPGPRARRAARRRRRPGSAASAIDRDAVTRSEAGCPPSAGPRSPTRPPCAPTPGTRKIERGISSRSRARWRGLGGADHRADAGQARLGGEAIGVLGDQRRESLEQRRLGRRQVEQVGGARGSRSARGRRGPRRRPRPPRPAARGHRRRAAGSRSRHPPRGPARHPRASAWTRTAPVRRRPR